MIDFSDKQYDDFLNIGYKSPIEKFVQDISNEMIQKEEQCLMETVKKVGFVVDKEELYKALKYDREQYDKGYEDCKQTIKKNLLDTFEYVNISFPFDNGEVKTIQEIIIEVLG